MSNNPDIGRMMREATVLTKDFKDWAQSNGGADTIRAVLDLREKFRAEAVEYREMKRLKALPIEQLEAAAEKAAARARIFSAVLKERSR